MADQPIKIFYSWQSWTPSERNRKFIEDSLQEAINQIADRYGQSIVIDRDTKDLSGAPAIAEAILEKIEGSDIFLADVTFVVGDNDHKSPNPNVMLELGYAAKCLGWKQIILVMNTASGEPDDDLPFDLQHRRWPITYKLESGQKKSSVRDQFIGGLKQAIEMILQQGLPLTGITVPEQIERLIEAGQNIALEKLVRSQIEQAYQKTSSVAFFNERQSLLGQPNQSSQNRWNVMFNLYFRECQDELRSILSLCWYGQPDCARYISTAVTRWMEKKANDPQPYTCWNLVPTLFLMYVAGIVAVNREKWHFLIAAINSNPKPDSRNSQMSNYSFEEIINDLVYYYSTEYESRMPPFGSPIGRQMQQTLQPLFAELMPSVDEFNTAFDILELLLELHLFDLSLLQGHALSIRLLSRYGRSLNYVERSRAPITSFLNKIGKFGDNWDILKLGLFNGNSQHLAKVIQDYQEILVKLNNNLSHPLELTNYVQAYGRFPFKALT